jgi:hypothetical protein
MIRTAAVELAKLQRLQVDNPHDLRLLGRLAEKLSTDNKVEVDVPRLNLPLVNFHLVGQSVAGRRTTITIPELQITFDLGLATEASITTPFVAISHGHSDHIGSLHLHAFQRRMLRLSEPTYLRGRLRDRPRCNEVLEPPRRRRSRRY